MEMAGHECVGHVEIDKFANRSYEAMHRPKESEYFATDIRTVEPEDLPNADCYCFGFPCQAFSIAGKRGGFEDTRGTLFFEVMRLAAVRKPKYLFAENVVGLLSHNGGKTFGTILNTLGQLGYWYEYQVLNSKDFGVPQNRERVFIVGHLGGYSGRQVFPIIRSSSKTLKQIIDGCDAQRVYDSNGLARTLKAEGGGQGAKTGLYIIGKDGKKKNKDYASCLTAGGHSGGNHSDMDLIVQAVLTPDREEKRQNGRRFKEPGEPMFTLTSQDKHGVMFKGPQDISNTIRTGGKGSLTAKHNWDVINDGIRIRRLTPKECFRLQGFPDEYFERAKNAGISDSQLYKCAGNSVTVNVIHEIAKRL